MLQQYRASGRKIFLLTNSLWDYTYVVMNYLQGGKDKCRADRRDLAWLEYFDLVIVGASKPAFLVEDGDKYVSCSKVLRYLVDILFIFSNVILVSSARMY